MKKLTYIFTFFLASLAFAQSPITSIPFELYGDHIIFKVSVDKSAPLKFIFDTGSGLTVVDSDVAKDLKLSGKKVEMGEATTMELIKHNEIEINGFAMEKNIKVYSTNLDHLERSLGLDIDGIVGYDLLHHHIVNINYEDQVMNIYELGKGPEVGDAIPFELNMSIPTIKGTVLLNNNEPHDGTFFILSGAGTSLDFNSPYAAKYDVINKTGKHFSYLVKSISDVETLHYEGHVLSFAFGNQTIEDLPIGISQAKSGVKAHSSVSGIIGNKILSMYNVTIDYSTKMLYFEKNANFGKTLSINCSGIDLQLSKNKKKLLVHRVFEDSPADEAGIKVDAEFLSINGESADDLTLPQINNMLKKEGETVSVTLNQDGKEKTVSLTLKSLID
jgi:hypothetical protein